MEGSMTDSIKDARLKQPVGQDVYDATDVRRVDDNVDVEDLPLREADDVSPHFGGRAQPGDLLGIETGGETTEIGDTAEDENERRRDLEKDKV
jgi:hypothetical protein